MGLPALKRVLTQAHDQSAYGKGRERHGGALPFDRQPIMQITAKVGLGFPVGQAVKKCFEAMKMLETHQWEADRAADELLGAIVYLGAAVHFLRPEQPAGLDDLPKPSTLSP